MSKTKSKSKDCKKASKETKALPERYAEGRGSESIKEIEEQVEKSIRTVFGRIDEIIEDCSSEKPVPYNESKFKKMYEKLKEEYLQ